MTQETEGLVEAVARWLCEYVGGDPDMVDPHVITDEGKPFDGPLWQVFAKDAHAIIPIVAAHFAEVARGIVGPRGDVPERERIATAIEEVGRHG